MPAPPRVVRPEGAPRSGYRLVLRHRTFVAYAVMNAALIGVGFSLLGDIFPAFAKNTAGVSERGIGLCFLANTLVIVVAQLPVAKWLEGRRRMAALQRRGSALGGRLAGRLRRRLVADGSWAAVVFAAALTVFGFGECFHGTVAERTRGRPCRSRALPAAISR